MDTPSIFMLIFTTVIMLYCVMNGSRILNVFNPEGEGVVVSYTNRSSSISSSNVQLTTLSPNSVNTSLMERGTKSTSEIVMTDGGEDHSGTADEKVFFHVLMVLSACYFTMLLTSWSSSGAYGSDDEKVVRTFDSKPGNSYAFAY